MHFYTPRMTWVRSLSSCAALRWWDSFLHCGALESMSAQERISHAAATVVQNVREPDKPPLHGSGGGAVVLGSATYVL